MGDHQGLVAVLDLQSVVEASSVDVSTHSLAGQTDSHGILSSDDASQLQASGNQSSTILNDLGHQAQVPSLISVDEVTGQHHLECTAGADQTGQEVGGGHVAAADANVGIGGCDMSSSYFLPRLIGTGRAFEMMLTGNFINADEAWNLGLVSKVVENRAALVPAGLELARVIAAKDPMAVRLTREAMRANVDAAGFDNALQVENRNQTLMIAHNVNKDASQDPIGKYWIEDRTDPQNPKGAN